MWIHFRPYISLEQTPCSESVETGVMHKTVSEDNVFSFPGILRMVILTAPMIYK